MAKYRIMVIDDRYDQRVEKYKSVLGEKFDLVIPKNPDEFYLELKKNVIYHGYIIDIFYDIPWKSWSFGRVITSIGNQISAIIAISSEWGNDNLYGEITGIPDSSVIGGYLSWNDFEDCCINGIPDSVKKNKIVSNVHNILARYHKRTMIQKEDNSPINILHLSDLHFGASGSMISKVPIPSVADKICNKLKDAPDLVVITGDIAHSGKKEEYNTALEWFDSLFKNFWQSEVPDKGGPKQYGQRVILVPGNHDFDYQLCAGDYFSYDIKNCEWITAVNKTSIYSEFGLYPFRQFAYDITNNANWLVDDYHEMGINNAYLQWGIRFIHINTITGMTTRDHINSTPATLDERIVLPQKIQNYSSWSATGSVKDMDCMTILLSHHNLQDFKNRASDEWTNILHYFDYSQAKLLLSGHNHQEESNKINEEINENDQKIRHFVAPSLCYNGAKNNGFSVYQFERSNGIVHNVNKFSFSIDSGNKYNVVLSNEKPYKID